MASDPASPQRRAPSPALIEFSDSEEGGGAVFSPGDEAGDQLLSSRPDRQSTGDQSSPAPLPRCTLQTTPPKVNSVRVPFDPDDQSDDEIVITSVYKKQTATASSSAGPASSHDGSGDSNNDKMNDNHPANTAKVAGWTAINQRTPRPGSSSSAKRAVAGRDGNSSKNHSPSKTPKATANTPKAAAHTPKPKRPEIPLAPLSEVTGMRAQPPPDLKPGSVYPGRNVPFCPWSKVVNYHTQYVGKVNGVRVAPYFALDELLQCQDWDLCYLWHPAKDKQKTFVLVVPTEQVTVFLGRINKTLAINLTIPAGDLGNEFRVALGGLKTPVPRFLGHVHDAAALDVLVKNIPPRHVDDAITTPKAEEFYLKKINFLLGRIDKAERKKMKTDKARQKRVTEHKRWGRQAKRIQRYLGLRKETATADSDTPPRPRDLDLTMPAPFGCEGDVLFVAMDIESYEHHHRTLTEIGFAVLDTRDVVGVPPGPNGEGWHQLIQARHLRIRENAHLVNRQFLQGCENNFNFGTSEFVRLREILSVVTDMLQPADTNSEPRKVILVGHDIRSDIKMVKNIGFYVKEGMFLEVVDTQDLHQHYRLSTQNAGLRTVLHDLRIEHMFLHNAGNDAVYTMQALVTLAIVARQGSIRKQDKRQDPSYKPDPETLAQGWDTGGELSDGGLPDDDLSYVDTESPAKTTKTVIAAENTAGSRPPSRQGTPRATTPAPATQTSQPFDPWPTLGHTTSPPVVPVWPPPVNELDDLIDL